jgi:predicted 3-demethylubiquinone-9 3-methyltransferase (glyoxalase superfamily)
MWFDTEGEAVPTELIEMISDPDPGKASRVTAAMLKMTKFDIAALRQVYAGQ